MTVNARICLCLQCEVVGMVKGVPMPETIEARYSKDFVQLVDWCEIPEVWRDQLAPTPKGSLEYDGMTDARCSGSSVQGDM